MILFKYLLKEVAKSQLAVTFVLLTIFISENFVRVLSSASDGDFPATLVASILALNVPWLAALVLPLSVFLGVIFAHGRMYADSEMTVLHAVGVSEWYVARVTILIGLINMVIVAAITMYVSPWAQQTQKEILAGVNSKAGLAVLSQGRFQKAANGKAVIFVENIENNNELENVFVTRPENKDGKSNLVFAQKGRIVEDEFGSQVLELDKGNRYQLNPERADYQIIQFGQYRMRIKERESSASQANLREMGMSALLEDGGPRAMGEFHWRLGVALCVPILTLIAVPLARVKVRQGKFAKLGPAIMLYLGYFGLLVAGRQAFQSGAVPSWLGLWWVHILGICIAFMFLAKERPIFAKLLAFRFKKEQAA